MTPPIERRVAIDLPGLLRVLATNFYGDLR